MFNFNIKPRYGKHFDFQLSNDYTVKLKENTEYVPLFFINKSSFHQVICPTNNSNYKELALINNYIDSSYATKKIYQNRLNYYISTNSNTIIKTNQLLINTKNYIKDYLKFNIPNFNNYLSNNFSSYEQLFDTCIQTSALCKNTLRSNTFITHFGFLALNTNTFKPLFQAMIKKEHLKYFKLCYITNTQPDYSLVEFWVDSELLDNDDYKSIKMAFNKTFKPKLASGIKIVKVNNLLDYSFDYIKTPVFATISGKKQFENSVLNDFIQDTIVENQLNSRVLIED